MTSKTINIYNNFGITERAGSIASDDTVDANTDTTTIFTFSEIRWVVVEALLLYSNHGTDWDAFRGSFGDDPSVEDILRELYYGGHLDQQEQREFLLPMIGLWGLCVKKGEKEKQPFFFNYDWIVCRMLQLGMTLLGPKHTNRPDPCVTIFLMINRWILLHTKTIDFKAVFMDQLDADDDVYMI